MITFLKSLTALWNAVLHYCFLIPERAPTERAQDIDDDDILLPEAPPKRRDLSAFTKKRVKAPDRLHWQQLPLFVRSRRRSHRTRRHRLNIAGN